MTEIALRVEGLGKRYRIGETRAPYRTIREAITSVVTAPARRVRAMARGQEGWRAAETMWALRDVNFEIRRGDVVGIIGRNGAGKSTLLKILSRITEPSTGLGEIHGRVGSLLEVGTGFHPELTGRDNIFLNGAILGMRRADIKRRFDEIVAFAEVERFIDTPVKHYSSGMYLRLAFAVAAHLEPEILLVDEVLAVGDAEFQRKCLGKMEGVAKEGRTVLFVSHQMNAVQTLCPRTLWLQQGQVEAFGETRDVIGRYLRVEVMRNEWRSDGSSAVRNAYFNPLRMAIVDRGLNPVSQDVRADQGFGVLIEGVAEASNVALTVGFALHASGGELLFWALHTDVPQDRWPPIRIGHNRLVAWVPPHLLNEGEYRIDLILSLHFQEWLSQPGVTAPSVGLSVKGGLSESPYWMMARPGLLGPVIPFEAR
jgi:homopolymeric O-antigen transport system ATP-binding protein